MSLCETTFSKVLSLLCVYVRHANIHTPLSWVIKYLLFLTGLAWIFLSLLLGGERKLICFIFVPRQVLLLPDSFEFAARLALMKLCNIFNSLEYINTQNLPTYLLKTENLLRPSISPHAVMIQHCPLPSKSPHAVMAQPPHPERAIYFIMLVEFCCSTPRSYQLFWRFVAFLNLWVEKRKWVSLGINNSLYWNIIQFSPSPLKTSMSPFFMHLHTKGVEQNLVV